LIYCREGDVPIVLGKISSLRERREGTNPKEKTGKSEEGEIGVMFAPDRDPKRNERAQKKRGHQVKKHSQRTNRGNCHTRAIEGTLMEGARKKSPKIKGGKKPETR